MDEHAERHPHLTDAVIVIALLLGAILGVSVAGPGEGPAPDAWIGGIVAGLACLALVNARRHPRSTVVITTACTIVLGTLGYLLTPLLLAPLMAALYWLATTSGTRTTWIYGGTATVLSVGAAVGISNFDATVTLRAIGPALWLLLPLAMGSRTRLRHAWLAAVRARAEHAEQTRDEEARLRVAEERMRIARDLHDIVAHHMAVANAQAGTAAHLLDTNPKLTKQILADLQTTTSSVMLELHDTVGVLRQHGSDPDTLEPTPGLDRLPELLEACQSAGLTVGLKIEGDPRDLTPGVDLTAYRIIQEALTNATKYSASASATLLLRYTRTSLTITITNDTKPQHTQARKPGFGLIGMRERAHTVGGQLRVSDQNDAQFEVTTTLPLPVSAAHPRPAHAQPAS